MSAERKRLVTLISSGSNLQSLLEGCASGQINGDMVGVLSNRPGVFGLSALLQLVCRLWWSITPPTRSEVPLKPSCDG
ncbi:MAG: hypothetical protein R3E89_14840 [Thiolinea sp.]